MTQNIDELKIKLESDKKELQELELLLEDDPQNEELQVLRDDLIDLIRKASDILTEKTRINQSNNNNHNNQNTNNKFNNEENIIRGDDKLTPTSSSTPINTFNTTPSPPSSSSSTIISNDSIIIGNSNEVVSVLAVGSKCEGKYSVDGEWYAGVITEIKPDGKYQILYDGYGNTEALSMQDIRPVQRARLGGNIKDQSSRFAVAGDSLLQIPKHLKINADDSEEVKKQKMRRQHSIKSQNRLYKVDEENRKQKQKWQDFQNKPKKSIPGTFTDRKKGSMFSTTDFVNGRVGVIGSGKEMTQSTTFINKKTFPTQ